VDRELVFLPDIVLVDNEQRAIPFETTGDIGKPTAYGLKSRLVTLKRGQKIKRQVYLRRGFKRFVTGISTPARLGGNEFPKVTAYETLSRMPVGVRPFGIEVLFQPGYAFEEGFAHYMQGIDAAQFYRGPLRMSLAYKFGREDVNGSGLTNGVPHKQ